MSSPEFRNDRRVSSPPIIGRISLSASPVIPVFSRNLLCFLYQNPECFVSLRNDHFHNSRHNPCALRRHSASPRAVCVDMVEKIVYRSNSSQIY
jgi:hypothetical protein